MDSARGWVVVAAAFVSTFTVFGVAYSFGAFFEPMAAEFGSGRGATSLVFSITAALYFSLGTVSGRLTDRFGPRPVLLTGAVVMAGGLLLTAQVDRLWLGYITYGVGVGIGVACGYVPMVAVVGAWFERRRGVALGVAVSGIGLGTLLVAPLAAGLIERYDWRTTYMVFGVATAVLLTAAAAIVAPAPTQTAQGAPPRLAESLRTRAFAALYGSALLMSLALFVPFVHLPAYAEGQGVASVAAAALVGFIGGSSTVGRLALGALADRLGAVLIYKLCFALMGVSFALWLFAPGYGTLVAFALVLGVGYGGFIALSPSVIASQFGLRGLGGMIGIVYSSAAIGALAGPTVAGWLIDATGGYTASILVAMVMAIASAVALLPLRDPS